MLTEPPSITRTEWVHLLRWMVIIIVSLWLCSQLWRVFTEQQTYPPSQAFPPVTIPQVYAQRPVGSYDVVGYVHSINDCSGIGLVIEPCEEKVCIATVPPEHYQPRALPSTGLCFHNDQAQNVYQFQIGTRYRFSVTFHANVYLGTTIIYGVPIVGYSRVDEKGNS